MAGHYAFTDMAGEHFVILTGKGMFFTETFDPECCLVVSGEPVAQQLADYFAEVHDAHLVPVMLTHAVAQ